MNLQLNKKKTSEKMNEREEFIDMIRKKNNNIYGFPKDVAFVDEKYIIAVNQGFLFFF